MEYVIDKRDYIKFESDIVASGCVNGLAVPKIYETSENVYFVFGDFEAIASDEISFGDIEVITEAIKKYMLNPNRIVFHPSCISKQNGVFTYHYLPSKRPLLYSSDDLRRYIVLGDSNKNIDNDAASGLLYLKTEKRAEKLSLKHTLVGNTPKCSIKLDFDGMVKISNTGILTVIDGKVKVNDTEISGTANLKKGDSIQFGNVETVYW